MAKNTGPGTGYDTGHRLLRLTLAGPAVWPNGPREAVAKLARRLGGNPMCAACWKRMATCEHRGLLR